jgi:hypothetical protein
VRIRADGKVSSKSWLAAAYFMEIKFRIRFYSDWSFGFDFLSENRRRLLEQELFGLV